jgi:hypothetical protein
MQNNKFPHDLRLEKWTFWLKNSNNHVYVCSIVRDVFFFWNFGKSTKKTAWKEKRRSERFIDEL